MNQTLNNLKKYPLAPLIECLFLSLPILIISCLMIIGTNFKNIEMTFDALSQFLLRSVVALPILFVFIANIIFYFVLKKKCELDASVFLHGVGFASSVLSILLLYYISIAFNEPIDIAFHLWVLHIVPFVSLFYLYAALPKNNEKNINLITICLTIVTVAFFIFSITMDEIFRHLLTAFILPIFLGAYAGYYAVYKTARLNSRLLAWTPVLLLLLSGLILLSGLYYLFLIVLILPTLGNAIEIIAAFICFFIISYLLGRLHKYLIKQKNRDENNETI